MKKVLLIIVVVLFGAFLLLISPFVYLGLRDGRQIRSLQNRSDFPQIALAGVQLANSVTGKLSFLAPTDPRVPATLRSLSPKYINAATNDLTMEFHGGFDHYGYKLRQSEVNPKLWTLFFYTENREKPLTTVTNF